MKGKKEKVYILAGNHEQARRHAQVMGYKPNEWVFYDRREKILGMYNIKLALVGTYEQLPNVAELLLEAEFRKRKELIKQGES